MKRISLLMLILLFSINLCGQRIIKGVVTDTKGASIAYANIVALTVDDSVYVAGTTSDDFGRFEFRIPINKVLLHVSYLGYQDCYVPVGNESLTITLQESSISLKEVVVSGSLPQYKMTGEGLQTNIEGTVLSKMGTLEDVLKHVPSVVKKGDKWIVFGKGTPLIYLNGRQLHDMSELDNIKSGEVKSIEVIQNPGAKYKASVSAVIRIKTIRRKGEGFSTDVRSTYSYNKYNDFIEQLNANYKRDQFNAFVTYKYSNTRSIQDADFEQTIVADTLWKQYSDNYDKGKTEYHYLQTGLYYDFNDNHSIGAKYSIVLTGDEHVNGFMDNNVWADGKFYDRIVATSYDKVKDRPIHRMNTYYRGMLGTTSIDFNTDLYFKHGITLSDLLEESKEYDTREITSKSDAKNQMVASQLAFVTPIGEGSFRYGSEYIHSSSKNWYEPSRVDLVARSNSKITEQQASAYVEYSHSTAIGDFLAGIRYEYVRFKYSKNGVYLPEQSRSFNNIFPSLQYSSKIGNLMWQFSYSAKTQRPNYSQLSSNVSYSNRFTRQSGNPLLKNQISHTVELSGVWSFLQFMVDYKYTRNAIIYWAEQMPENEAITLIRYRNEKYIKNASAFISAAPKLGIWSPQINLGAQKQWFTLHTDVGDYKLNKPIFVANLNNALNLPMGITFTADFAFQGKGNQQNAEIIKNQYVLNIGFSKSFFRKALILELKGNDLLYKEWDTVLLYNEKMQLQQLCRRGTREFSVTLRYRFNTSRNKYKGTGAGSSVIDRF